MTPDLSVYEREPVALLDGIPVFSGTDLYTENYAAIAADHMAALRKDGKNPFIPEEIWTATEASTRGVLGRYLFPGAAVLDAGVGLGRLLAPVADVRKYGMDIAPEYLREARGKGIEVCLARIEDAPYRPETFDAVVSTDVLEHVIDLNLCLGRLLRVLKPGGVLVLRVPYREELFPYLDPAYPYRFAHLRSFDEAGLRLLLCKVFGCGFLEWAPSGYRLDAVRLRYRLPAGEGLFLRLLSASRRLGAGRHARILEWAFHPIVFTMAFRKAP